MTPRAPRHLAAAYYFCYFGAMGGMLPFLSLFYKDAGMATSQIGLLSAIATMCMLLASPIWNGIADRFGLHHRLLPWLMRLTLPLIAALALSQVFGLLALFIALFAISIAPVVALADHAVLTLLGDQRHTYGRLRLWGSVGWGISAGSTGYFIEHTSTRAIFVTYIVVMLGGSLVAARLPRPRHLPATRYWTDIGAFIRQKRWQGFLLGVFLFGTGMAVLNTYFVLFIDSLGAGEGLYGLSVVAASISELPVFLLSSVVLRRWAPRALLTFAFSALILRCFIYSALRDPWLAIPAQLLHGPSFAAMWAAGVAYVSRLSPEGLGASAQALFGATNFGVSGTAGALLGSQLYDTAGPVTLFQIAGLIVLGGMISFLITEFRYGQRAT